MLRQQKEQLRTLVTTLRLTLQGDGETTTTRDDGDLARELSRLGFRSDGTITPLDALPNPTPAETRAYRAAEARLAALPINERMAARAGIVRRAAYSWINRLLALRAMEARDLIPETLRANPGYQGIPEALHVLRADQPARCNGPDGGWWAVLDDACNAQAQLLPGLFDPNDPHAALRPSAHALLTCVSAIGNPALDDLFRDPDAIGWAYQFYQQEAKARVYAKLGRGGKLEARDEIAAATQLFTEPYMVQWLLQNSLGRCYAEAFPSSTLPATWAYYIDRDKVLADKPTGNSEQSPANSERQTATSERSTGNSEEPAAAPATFTLEELTVLDPCMGSGHFLREAFDLLFAMYREQQPSTRADEIAAIILGRHLHGIDIDPRAAQLAALTLVLRAWELSRPSASPVTLEAWNPATLSLNLATTPTLAPHALQHHLKRHPEDAPFKPVLEAVFAVLEQAPILGSLIQPQAQLETALQHFGRQRAGGQLGLLGGSEEANAMIAELARTNPTELKRQLLQRIGRSFARAAQEGDAGAQLLGREAGEGLHLLQLLDRRYAVVATNPPYMGSKNMDAPLRQYVERTFPSAKRDLYAAFILRCLQLCRADGRVAMVTQQSWMFLKSFAELRAVPQEKLAAAKARGQFTGLLRETAIEALAHLGPNAFEEISGEVVQSAMFTLGKRVPPAAHRMVAIKVTDISVPTEKSTHLRSIANADQETYHARQRDFDYLPDASISYWLSTDLIELILASEPLKRVARLIMGLSTADNFRYTRCFWESKIGGRWFIFTKGGGYSKWAGLEWLLVDWEHLGSRVKSYPLSAVRNESDYLERGLTYSMAARGSIGVRTLGCGRIFEAKSPGVFVMLGCEDRANLVMIVMSSRCSNYILRAINPSIDSSQGYAGMLPLPYVNGDSLAVFNETGSSLIALKDCLIGQRSSEISFTPSSPELANNEAFCAHMHLVEGFAERLVTGAFNIGENSVAGIVKVVGTPAGWHPLVAGYDALPPLPPALNLPPLPQEVLDSLASHTRLQPAPAELQRLKARLRALYAAGPGARVEAEEEEEKEKGDDEDAETVVAGAYIPIPTETFLEELSVQLEIHPISVYWLLEELRREGARCKPEEKRLLEDRLTVVILRLLGHRWPRQIEAGEPVPEWADADGIIPLGGGTREATLAERVRARLRAEEGELAAQRSEALLQELTGRTLEEWLRRDFFKRHCRQFKRRPVAWQLASSPVAGGRRRGAEPAFECLVYYHRTDGDLLARLRTHYVERLLERERATLAAARQSQDETAQARAQSQIAELEDFARRLNEVEEAGFACTELDEAIAGEPLDRWSGDGMIAPESRDHLLAQERAWRVDLNDGVRVNIAPLQAAGLLAQDVIAGKDVRKAIADRARWRSDERRWVRVGKLPRCGWMDDSIRESPAWTALAPAREKERLRLQEKRSKVLAALNAQGAPAGAESEGAHG